MFSLTTVLDPGGRLQDWMHELMASPYEPSAHQATEARFVRLEGSMLRISHPKGKGVCVGLGAKCRCKDVEVCVCVDVCVSFSGFRICRCRDDFEC